MVGSETVFPIEPARLRHIIGVLEYGSEEN